MSIKESALSAITSITQSDFIRAVTSAGASRRVTVANLAKAIIESYTGSSLAGRNQSVKAALDALNSKTGLALTYTSNDYVTEAALNGGEAKRVGNLLLFKFNSSISNFPTGASVDNTQIGTISGWNASTATNITISPQNGVTSNGILLLTISNAGAITISNRSGLPCNGFYRGVAVASIN